VKINFCPLFPLIEILGTHAAELHYRTDIAPFEIPMTKSSQFYRYQFRVDFAVKYPKKSAKKSAKKFIHDRLSLTVFPVSILQSATFVRMHLSRMAPQRRRRRWRWRRWRWCHRHCHRCHCHHRCCPYRIARSPAGIVTRRALYATYSCLSDDRRWLSPVVIHAGLFQVEIRATDFQPYTTTLKSTSANTKKIVVKQTLRGIDSERALYLSLSVENEGEKINTESVNICIL